MLKPVSMWRRPHTWWRLRSPRIDHSKGGWLHCALIIIEPFDICACHLDTYCTLYNTLSSWAVLTTVISWIMGLPSMSRLMLSAEQTQQHHNMCRGASSRRCGLMLSCIISSNIGSVLSWKPFCWTQTVHVSVIFYPHVLPLLKQHLGTVFQ